MATALKDERPKETRKRLAHCWKLDLEWTKYPTSLKEGCSQIAKAMSVPPAAVLGGLLPITSYVISPGVVVVPGTDWEEPTILWLTISMPTGSRKTTIYQFLKCLIEEIREKTNCKEPPWLLTDATFEKKGVLMSENGGRLLAMFDELSSFLTKIKLYNRSGLTDSHELAMFLELYNSNPWTRATVTGEANFSMATTSLTVGGFNQPSVARNLIELPGNAEKGLSQRFLWLFPKPVYSHFDMLEPTNKDFTGRIVSTLAKLWKKNTSRGVEKRVFSLPAQDEHSVFRKKYDSVQMQLECIAGMDDLLSGMLSKSLGQILRVSAALHVLFSTEPGQEIPVIISDSAIEAAIDFVETCCQHTAYICGHGVIAEELSVLGSEAKIVESPRSVASKSNEAFVLSLPGKILDVSELVNKKKKFRNRGGREGAMVAMRQLEIEGLGNLSLKKTKGSIKVWNFEKAIVPEEEERRINFGSALEKYNISLLEYSKTFDYSLDETTKIQDVSPRKRPSEDIEIEQASKKLAI